MRIATNPEFAKMGYGSRALSVLSDFFSGKLVNLDEAQKEVGGEDFKTVAKFDKVSCPLSRLQTAAVLTRYGSSERRNIVR